MEIGDDRASCCLLFLKHFCSLDKNVMGNMIKQGITGFWYLEPINVKIN